ncbi:PREDICTED: translation initiation factor IF-2-like, partial [Chinchilla lanigera]|uniref:translation initiation factor IF-2-like n=1 Tax=Chinchilla lanigera TaxID=34839 RepID=UPI000699062E
MAKDQKLESKVNCIKADTASNGTLMIGQLERSDDPLLRTSRSSLQGLELLQRVALRAGHAHQPEEVSLGPAGEVIQTRPRRPRPSPAFLEERTTFPSWSFHQLLGNSELVSAPWGFCGKPVTLGGEARTRAHSSGARRPAPLLSGAPLPGRHGGAREVTRSSAAALRPSLTFPRPGPAREPHAFLPRRSAAASPAAPGQRAGPRASRGAAAALTRCGPQPAALRPARLRVG